MSDFWVRAVGGDDYVASVQNAAERKRLVEELKLSMKEVINTSIANDGPIYDWSAGLNRFTSALEQVLKHQMKTTKEGDKGPTADLWQYLQCLKDLLPSSSHIDVVDNLSNIKTREGKARAWFRLALNEKILADALQALINNKSSRTKWYNESALMCHAEDTMIIVNLLRGLSGVDFALSLNNDRLDHGNDSFPAASSKATQPKRKKKGGRRKRRQAVILDHNAPANIFPSSSPPSSSSSSTTKTTDINNSSEDDNYSTALPPISTPSKSDTSSFVAPSFSSSTVSIRSLPETLSTSSFVPPSSSATQTQRQPFIEQTIPENGNTAREDKTSATNAKSTNNSLPSGAEKMIEPKEQQEEETKEDEEKLKKEREIRALQEQLRMIEQKLSSAKAIQTITTRSPTQAKEDPTLQNDESSSSTSEAAATSSSPTSTNFASSDITPSLIVSQQQKITETENGEQGKHQEDKEEEPEEQEKEEEEEQETEEQESNKADTNGQVNTMSNAAASALASVTNVEYVGRTMSALIQNLQSLRQAPFAGTSSLSWRKKEEEKEVGVDDKQNKEEEETEEVEPWIVLDKDTMPSSEQNDQQNYALPQEEANAKQETTDDVSSVEEEKHSKEDDIAEEKEGQNVDDDTPIEDKGTSQEDAKAAYVPPETLYPFYFPFERPPHGEEKRSSEEESQQSLIEESNETTQQTPTNNPSVPSTSLTASTTAKPTTSPSASLSALSNSTTLRSLSASNNNNATASPAGRKRGHTKSYSLPAPSVLSSAFIDSLLAANTDIEFELDSTSSSASTSSNAKTSLSASSSPPSSSPPSSFSPSGSFSPAASSPRSSSSLSSSSSSSPTSSSTSSLSSTSPDSLEMSVKEKRTKDVINVTTFVVPPDPRDLFSASLLVHLPPQRTPSSPARTRSQSSLHRTRTLSLQRAALSSSSVGSSQTGWRPPKRQLHFVIHEKQSPREQGNLCAGCGSTFPPQGYLISTTRYCEYTGLHFCYECHVKDQCIIPSRVLANWDFKRYYVSRFARLFLREIAEEPAFNISVLNPALYTMVPALQKIKVLREQLFYMKDFVLTCRDKDRLLSPLLKPARLHLIYTTEEYSLRDLYEVSQNILLSFVRTIAEHFLLHILKCELCKAKGSFCEFCKSTTPIYPFQLRTTVQCPACRTLYHRNCFRLEECPKCLRLQQRAIIPPSSSNNAASSSS